MDLAKIRQKSRQELENRDAEASQPQPGDETSAAPSAPVRSAAARQAQDEIDYFDGTCLEAAVAPPSAYFQEPSLPVRAQKDPLSVILAGRAVAGCDEVQDESAGEQVSAAADAYQKYLCFKVSDEVYGINIMEIKELIKPREVTEVPRAPAFVSGVISLRGTIIPIIDMLKRLGLSRAAVTGRERLIVVRHAESFSGLLVDEIIQVVCIAEDSIEAAPTVLDGIDRDFVTGIGRADGRMIILLNIGNITDIHLY